MKTPLACSLALLLASPHTLAGQSPRPFAPLPLAVDVKTAPEPSRAPEPLAPRVVAAPTEGTAGFAARPAPIDARAPLSRASGIDRSRVYFDAPGDGSVWARGLNYKAGFDADGATYYPLFGAGQAQHHPHRLSPDLVTLGGAEIAFERGQAADVAGDRVQIERGAFTEIYDLTALQIEQTFVFPELRGAGDLVLRIPIASDLDAAECDAGFEFRAPRGRVTYGRAVAIDADGRRVAAPTALVDGAITIRVDASFLATAALPLVIDPVVTTLTIDTSSFNNYLADAAYDATFDRWLVVYRELATDSDYDVYYVMLNGAGIYLWGGYINSNPTLWWEPRCANLNSADQFLVAAPAGTAGDMEIKGRTVQAGLSSVSAEFFISGGESGWNGSVAVGGDPYPFAPASYCVAYERIYGPGDNDILVRLVGSNGSATPTTYLSNSGSTLDGSPSVSKSNGGSTWTIVWGRVVGSDTDVWAGRIRYDGLVVNTPFQITSGGLDRSPCVSSPLIGSQRTLIVFQRNYGTDYDIQGVLMDGATPIQHVDLTILENAQVFQNQIAPWVDSDGQHFLVGYAENAGSSTSNYDAYVADFYVSQNSLGVRQAHVNLAATGSRESNVRVASAQGSAGAGRRFMAVWDKQTTSSNHDILGALFDVYEGGAATPTCFGDGSFGACPCGNNGSAGRGCASSVNAAGALLAASGSLSTWSGATVLTASGLPSTSVCLFYQGTTSGGASAFGDGLNCTGGTVIRIGTKTASGGVASYPGAGDTALHVRGNVPLDGGTRGYQCWYRNSAAFCTPATFNVTNGVRIAWAR